MDFDRVRDYLLEQLKLTPREGIKRELDLADTKNRIVVVIGPRRAGKTYFFQELIDGKRDALYLNFEDTRLLDVKFHEIRDIVRLHTEISGSEPSRLFFDEIQNIARWEAAVRELLDKKKYKIYITGSSSKLLGTEIATQLRGRALRYLLLPFSFREFLTARGVEKTSNLTLDEQADLKNKFREYLEWGGFPEVVLEKGERERTLREYFEMILFKDIVERYKMKNIALARFIMAQIFQNFTKEISVNKLAKNVETAEKSRTTVYDYFGKVQDSVAIFFINRLSSKARIRESWPKKAYVCDNGLTKMVKFSEDIGKLMENLTFLELLRMTNERPLMEIYYWKESVGEVDFAVRYGGKIGSLIQVTYASNLKEVDRREIRSLLAASKATGCKKLIVLTWSYDGSKKIERKRILFVSLWKWLLGEKQVKL